MEAIENYNPVILYSLQKEILFKYGLHKFYFAVAVNEDLFISKRNTFDLHDKINTNNTLNKYFFCTLILINCITNID
jgi:hypothetical protein